VNQLGAEYFWRDAYKNEVDIVIPGTKPMPVEVKYGRVETGGVTAFMRKFKVNEGTIVSTGDEAIRKTAHGNIAVRPAYSFLLEKRKD
jgi:predicted AAA+ superfamily ATPase